MPQDTVSGTAVLRISRIFAAPREKVYDAWTQVEQLKNWWRTGADWLTPVVEIDLRVGGKYRLGMQPPDRNTPYIVGGVFMEITPAEKLVYTWRWEGQDEETVVTVEFIERGEKTEVILTHGRFAEEKMRDEHTHGWNGCLDQLETLL